MFKKMNLGILIPMLLLMVIGWLLVFSSSAYYSISEFNDPYRLISRHSVMLAMGLVVFLLAYVVNYNIYRNKFFILFITLVTLGLMLLTIVAGVEVNGAKRWIVMFGQRFMAVDFAKIAIIFYMSYSLTYFKPNKNYFSALLVHLFVPGVLMLLTILQPDFSSMLILLGVSVSILYLGFEHLKYLLYMGVGFSGVIGAIAVAQPYRLARIYNFIDGLKDIDYAQWQIKHGMIAIASGGIFGVGAGKSTYNKLWIPEPHNDMILSTLGEEFGFFGIIILTALYFVLTLNLIRLTNKLKDKFAKYITFGVTMTLFLQMVINYGNTLGILPPTGIPLPFVSYGGTNIILLSALLGVVMSISRMEEIQ